MKKFKGDLILTEDTLFKESIEVEGEIKGKYNIKVEGNINALNIDARNINARNIDAWNINAENIDAWNITAENIDAWNINARNIDAWNITAENINALNIDAWNINALNIDARNIILCESIKVKKEIKAKVLIKNRSKLEIKNWEKEQ
jgi:hypothetical protein